MEYYDALLHTSLPYICAKSDAQESSKWLPLWMHACDTAAVMRLLCQHRIPVSVKNVIGMKEDQLERLSLFLGYIHDIGKSTPVFQRIVTRNNSDVRIHLEDAGYHIPEDKYLSPSQTRHGAAGEAILFRLGVNQSLCEIAGAHHGKPQSLSFDPEIVLEAYRPSVFGCDGDSTWEESWEVWLTWALDQSGWELESLPEICQTAQMLLTAILIMADWIASNTSYFPLIDTDSTGIDVNYPERIAQGWQKSGFPEMWEPVASQDVRGLFQKRFKFPPNLMQAAVLDILASAEKPGIVIIEAPMGTGKTEAALAAAELMGAHAGAGGLFFGLPTQATANGIFPRLVDWTQTGSDDIRHAIRLAHGMAEMNDQYTAIFHGTSCTEEDGEDESRLMVHPWFQGRKQALLSDFVIGTVDQLLLMALRQKHVMLRHLGLAGKVSVVDECHAYDAFMSQYLGRALRWLGAYHVPVVLLSATLPAAKRSELMRNYIGSKPSDKTGELSRGYPLISWSDQDGIHQKEVHIHSNPVKVQVVSMDETVLAESVKARAREGLCCGIIVNTVKNAQRIAQELQNEVEVILIHAQFISADRADLERQLLRRIGKTSSSQDRRGLVIVGTQVMEQSLDIDFDILYTQLCPMDLLLQRIGRLHRHNRVRPQSASHPQVILLEKEGWVDKGTEFIYGRYLLERTRYLLPDTIVIPQDIPELVQNTYDFGNDYELLGNSYQKARADYFTDNQKKKRKAQAYLLDEPSTETIYDEFDRLEGLLDVDIDPTETQAACAVRDTQMTVEVLLLRRGIEGEIRFLSWQYGGMEVSEAVPDSETSRRIASQRLRLPMAICNSHNLNRLIDELENETLRSVPEWRKAPLLKGELVLILDEHGEKSLSGYRVGYERQTGFWFEEEDEADESTGV